MVTNTPIGQVLLTNIEFSVPAGLIGLSGLKKYPTEIISVDVTGGTVDAILLNITGEYYSCPKYHKKLA